MEETKVCVIVDSRTPVIIKIPVPPTRVTLADLKSALPAINQKEFKYFFKSNDSEFGIVKEEVQEDDCLLPSYRNRVVAWIVTPGHAGNELALSKDSTFKTFSEIDSDMYNSTYGTTSRTPGMTTSTTMTTSYDDGASSIITDLESTSYFTETDDSISCSNYSQTTYDTFVSKQRKNSRSKQLGSNRNNSNAPKNYLPGKRCYDTARSSPYRNGHVANHNGNGKSYKTSFHSNLDDLNNISSSSSSTTSSSTSSSASSTNSSCSDATAVQCITVHLVLTNENFLGLHIYANAVNDVDEGIYVDGVTENSAVAQDGRIEPGDKLIQVNDVNLEELTNDEAVKVLKDAVIKRGPLKLVVAKFIETNNNKNDPIAGLKEAVQPIDTAAWVAHAQALTIPNQSAQNQSFVDHNQRANSTNSSPSFGSINAQDTDCIRPASTGMHGLGFGSSLRLNRHTNDMREILQHMQIPEFGIELKDREWLKIQIPCAFLGSDLVAWLGRNVCGFNSEREAKKFASKMLKEGLIKDPISKKSFSSRSYYTFETHAN